MGTETLFRVGPGYVERWMHIALHHNTLNEHETKAVREVGNSLGALIRHRNAIETARRSFMPASLLDVRTRPANDVQEALFGATTDFILNFYAAVSAMAGMVKRFSVELGSAPHASNERFLEWLANIGLFSDQFDTLRAARDFRTIIDHKASNQPYAWATTVDDYGLLRAYLHGPASRTGAIPRGAQALPAGTPPLPDGYDWLFLAPDEDRVLTLLAVQLNMLIPLIQEKRYRADSLPCDWRMRPGPGEPEGGYPEYAYKSGTIVNEGPMLPALTDEDQLAIDAILEKYVNEIRREPGA